MKRRVVCLQHKRRKIRKKQNLRTSSEISGIDEPPITECRREEMEVSSKIEDKMDAMMMRIEQDEDERRSE